MGPSPRLGDGQRFVDVMTVEMTLMATDASTRAAIPAADNNRNRAQIKGEPARLEPVSLGGLPLKRREIF